MKSLQVAVVLGVAIVGGFVVFCVHKKRQKMKPPQHGWEHVGTIGEIMLHPIRSCGGLNLPYALCEKNGLSTGTLQDRRLVLVNEDDQTLTASAYPIMWQIRVELIGEDLLIVNAPDMEELVIYLKELTKGKKETVKQFDDKSMVSIECDSFYANWFSKFILGKEGLRLFVHVKSKKIPFCKNMDVNPYLILLETSIADLNARLENKISYWRFRGNLFIKSEHTPPYSEDNWKWMRIGNDAMFRYKAPCLRCIMPNVNPFTSERSKDFEPLRTLRKYRMKPGQLEPELGVYFDLHKEGLIRLNDPVFANKSN